MDTGHARAAILSAMHELGEGSPVNDILDAASFSEAAYLVRAEYAKMISASELCIDCDGRVYFDHVARSAANKH